MSTAGLDAVVVGAGPNGLAAAIEIARAGRRVVVFEAAASVGGGCRSAELTLPGFVHDVCSAVHPLAVMSPAFRSMPLASHGVEWVEPPVMFAHPFDGGGGVSVYKSVARTARQLGRDGPMYQRLFDPLARLWAQIEQGRMSPWRWLTHGAGLGRVAFRAPQSAERVARVFGGGEARALLAGASAHSMLPLDVRPTGGIGLALAATAHMGGWYMPKGGAQVLADGLASYLRSLGGTIVTGANIASFDDLPHARAVLCDLSPRPLLRLAGSRFPARFRRALERYRYGMAAFKVDWALDGPIPWRHPECAQAGTVHLGGGMEEIAVSERDAWEGRHTQRPFVLLSQPTVFDPSRAPTGRHIAWTYCHVPNGSTEDMLPRIEQQIERFAPGFRDRVLARAVMGPADIERYNPNFAGGDIAAGVSDLRQLLARPTWRTYSTPVNGLYICSAATPPGVGVHGMCGYLAARRALREVLRD